MATPRTTEPDDVKEPGPEPGPVSDEWCAYTDARVHALSQRIDSVEDKHRRLVLLLVILAYALAFGYLVGRDTCQR